VTAEDEPFDPLASFAAIERLVSKNCCRFPCVFLTQPKLRTSQNSPQDALFIDTGPARLCRMNHQSSIG